MGECLMFGLDLESRYLSNVPAEEEVVQLLIGTHNIKMDNQICRLSLDGEYSRISSLSFPHPAGEVRGLAASPSNANIVASAAADFHGSPAKFGIHLWEMDGSKGSLKEMASVPVDECPLSFEWDQQSDQASSLFQSSVQVLDCDYGLKVTSKRSLSGTAHAQAWNPHSAGNLLGLAVDKDIMCHDLRTSGTSCVL
ncbi:hypothetical protein ANCDUO_27757 [Ancylostoma duodenale]|uniref:WD domain, G-beta repeat protein n=1 Tax=Ancylostoma duodenale TaxID=51022 RepID=A0A0C2F136_9BILA|nr:hypothetical protein ANCDUO_27757 [Ancylostoma duodenale]